MYKFLVPVLQKVHLAPQVRLLRDGSYGTDSMLCVILPFEI